MMHRSPLLSRTALFLAVTLLIGLAGRAGAATPPDERTRLRLRSMGSACFTIPTGYCRSEAAYVSDDSHSLTMVSQKMLGKFAELSLVRHLNGQVKDRNVFNLKLNVLEEDTFLPNIVWGVADVRQELGSKIFFFAGSKTIEPFGTTVHAGVYKDPITTDKEVFVGFEKTVFPLVVLAAERIHDKTTIGVKLRPYPGVSVEYARRSDAPDDQASLYRLVYLRSF